jgi:hypothetical protein
MAKEQRCTLARNIISARELQATGNTLGITRITAFTAER